MATQLKAAEDAPAKKSKKKLVMIVVPVLVIAVVGYLMMGKKSGATAKPAPKPGVVVALDPITINLAGGHYLKLGLALQATKAAKEAPDGSEALDLAIETFSNKTVVQLNSNVGRTKYKKELTAKVVKAYTPDGGSQEVMDLYFTEFVMQ